MKRLMTVFLGVVAGLALCSLSPAYAQVQTGTYIASAATQVTTAAVLVSLEAPSNRRLRVWRICVGTSNATAAAAVTVTVRRTTTASSGGTTLDAEATGVTSISKLGPNSANYTGVGRLGGTPGTAGATLDQWGFTIGEVGAGTADALGPAALCMSYGQGRGDEPIIVNSGTSNGVSVNVSAAGAGGLASGSISILFTAEEG